MSKIVSPDANRRPLQSRQQAIVTPPRSTAPDLLNDLGEDFGKMAEVRDKDEWAKAKSKYLMLRAEQDDAYNDDEDFDTIEERWSGVMNEGFADVTVGISNPQLREQFMMEYEPHMEQGRQRIMGVAGDKAKDYERGEIDEELVHLGRAAESDAGDPVAIHQAVRERLEAAAGRNIISHEEAQNIGDQFRNEVSLNKLKAMGPEDRLDALTAPWAANIPAHSVKQLREEAKDELRLGKAQGIADTAFSKGWSRTQLRKDLLSKGKDPKLINDAMVKFGQYKQQQTADEAETAVEFYEGYGDAIRRGAITDVRQIMDAQPQLWEQLTEQMKSNLQSDIENVSKGVVRTKSDRPTWTKLSLLHKQAVDAASDESSIKWSEFRSELFKNHSKLNDADYQQFAGYAIGGPAEGVFSPAGLVEIATRDMTGVKAGKIASQINSWVIQETLRNDGQPPNESAVQDAIDRAVTDESYSRSFLGVPMPSGSDIPQNLDIEERVEVAIGKSSEEDREKFINLMESEEERDELRVEIFKELAPHEWIRLQNFIDERYPEGTVQPSFKQLRIMIAKMRIDPSWPPK